MWIGEYCCVVGYGIGCCCDCCGVVVEFVVEYGDVWLVVDWCCVML